MARSVISVFIAFALILFIAGIRTQEVEDESEFEYKEGPKGPEHWGELKEEWKACGNGTQQSPIDVVKQDAVIDPDLGTLRRFYYPAKATLMNRGHDIMVNWSEGAGGVEIEGKRFTLNQCHWHTPAEHTVDGKRHPLEIHMVQQAQDGEITVIGIIYNFGSPDTFLAEESVSHSGRYITNSTLLPKIFSQSIFVTSTWKNMYTGTLPHCWVFIPPFGFKLVNDL